MATSYVIALIITLVADVRPLYRLNLGRSAILGGSDPTWDMCTTPDSSLIMILSERRSVRLFRDAEVTNIYETTKNARILGSNDVVQIHGSE